MVEPAGVGVTLLHITTVMLTLSWVVLLSRLAVRRWIKQTGLDDYLMCAGLILYSVTCSLVIVCCFYGSGQLSESLDAATIMQGTKLFFIAEFFYASCTVLIKSSICVTLLRIADARRRFVWTLHAIIGLSAIAAVIFILAIANICHPITTLWGETTYGECNSSLNSNVSFLFSAVSILTDWTLAILPAILLWNIQMKTRIKVSVAIILGLAAFASCATIIRLRYLTLYNNQAEFMFSTGQIGLWSVVEEGIGIAAGSMSALRPLLSLPIFGGRSQNASNGSRQLNAAGSPWAANDAQAGHEGAVKMDTFRYSTNSAHKRRESEDGDSQKHILKETQVTITAEQCPLAGPGPDAWKRQQVLGWNDQDNA